MQQSNLLRGLEMQRGVVQWSDTVMSGAVVVAVERRGWLWQVVLGEKWTNSSGGNSKKMVVSGD